MEYIPDPELRNELLDRLAKKYLTTRPDIPHVSELISCLTRNYFDRLDPIERDDETLLGFAVGFALEGVLLRDLDTPAPDVQEVDGIFMSRDYVDLSGIGADLKSTRMYPDLDGSPKRGWPEGWLEQFKAYMKIDLEPGDPNERLPYRVAILYITQRALETGTLVFTRQEVEDEWDYLLERKKVYMNAFLNNEVPTPFKYNKTWECDAYGGCPRKDTCLAIQRGDSS